MDKGAPIIVQLVGGPMDGDEQVWQAHGSVAPPGLVAYLGTRNGVVVWQTYQADNCHVRWGDEVLKYKFHYTGATRARVRSPSKGK